MLPPLAIGSVESAARATGARQWLASLSVPGPTRVAATAVLDAVAQNNFKAAGKGLKMLIEAGTAQLDPASIGEMAELASELASAALPPS